MVVDTSYREIPLDQLIVSKYNVRKHTDPETIRKLAEDIRKNGLHEPLVVRPEDGKFGVVIGGRRLRAIRLIREKWPEDFKRHFSRGIPCIVKSLDPRDAMIASLSENYHKQSLTPDEYGAAIDELTRLGVSREEIEERVRMEAEEIERFLRVYRAIKEIEEATLARPGRPPEKRKKPKKKVSQKALVTARTLSRRLSRKGVLREPEKFEKVFVEKVAEADLSAKEIEKVAEQVKREAPRVKSETQIVQVVERAIEEIRKIQTVMRVVLLEKDVADAVSVYAKKKGVKFDDALNDLLRAELKRRGYM